MSEQFTNPAGDTAAAAVPGWYLDESNPGFNRYWDGQVWTQNLAPVAHAEPTGFHSQPATKKPTNSAAIASLVFGLLGLFGLFITSPIAVVLGHIALSKIRRNGDDGKPLAVIGLMLGYLGTLALTLLVLFVIAAFRGYSP